MTNRLRLILAVATLLLALAIFRPLDVLFGIAWAGALFAVLHAVCTDEYCKHS